MRGDVLIQTDCHMPKMRKELPTGYVILSGISSKKSGIVSFLRTAVTSSTPTDYSFASLM
jgi:hypothetical protein